MSNFNNVGNTGATVAPGFAYADFAAQMDSVFAAVTDAANTLSSPPASQNVIGNQLVASWSDGTTLVGDIVSMNARAVSLNHLDLHMPTAWAEAYGKLTVTASGNVPVARATQLGFGNDQVAEIWRGSLSLNLTTGAVSGKINTMTLAWSIDDPLTPIYEWQYVTLSGSAGITGAGALTGTVKGVEWGTATSSTLDGPDLSYASAGSVSGLKLNAASLYSTVESGGFAALSAGLYAGNDVINGTSGNDYLDGSTGNDKIFGNAGDDEIYGGAGNDQLFGGAGNDFISGGAGNDKIVDTEGHNTIVDMEGNAQVTAGGGDDSIDTGAGNNKIVAGDGDNEIDAGDGNNNVIAGAGDDEIFTGRGNDKIVAGDGDNDVDAGDGNNNVVTGSGADYILTGAGNDKIVAGAGIDFIDGGAGKDNIIAGDGSDTLSGGIGADKLFGGAGADTFVFDNLAVGGFDTIMDFDGSDIIAFDATVFTSLAGGIGADNFVRGTAALDANDYLIFNPAGGRLYYDADGNGAGAAVQIVAVNGATADLGYADFQIFT